jgi:hypothetical protein
MISSCSSEEDIKLLFEILQKLRVFVSPIHFPRKLRMLPFYHPCLLCVYLLYLICTTWKDSLVCYMSCSITITTYAHYFITTQLGVSTKTM